MTLRHRDVYGSAFSASGDEIYSVGWDKKLRVWNATTGELINEQEPASSRPDKRMYTVCTDATGKYLATCTLNESIGLYDTETRELIREWGTGSSFVYGALRFSPDGLWLASGSASGSIVVWDPLTGEQLHKIKAHEDSVYTIDIGKDNRTICSGGANVGYVWS